MNNGRTSSVKKGVLAVIVLALLVALIGGTYARYSTSASGNAKTQVAKWAVSIKHGSEAVTTTKDITFTLADSNNKVEGGKIAPASKLTSEIDVDMTGTEVAAKLAAEVTQDSLTSALGTLGDRVTFTTTVDGQTYTPGTPAEIALADVSKVHKVIFTLEWKDSDTTEENAKDTTIGEAAAEITLPVTITATQWVN